MTPLRLHTKLYHLQSEAATKLASALKGGTMRYYRELGWNTNQPVLGGHGRGDAPEQGVLKVRRPNRCPETPERSLCHAARAGNEAGNRRRKMVANNNAWCDGTLARYVTVSIYMLS